MLLQGAASVPPLAPDLFELGNALPSCRQLQKAQLTHAGKAQTHMHVSQISQSFGTGVEVQYIKAV